MAAGRARTRRDNRRRGVLLAGGVLLSLVAGRGAGQPDRTESRKEAIRPADSGLVEKTKVSLILLDVEVLDEKGNPIPGLKKEDFHVWLNGREREIYSVDDLCGGAAAPSGAGSSVASATASPAPAAPTAASTSGASTAASPASPADASASRAPLPADASAPRAPLPTAASAPRAAFSAGLPLVVLYLDFMLLQPDGRTHAIAAAKEWLGASLAPGQRALVVASTRRGLRELCPATEDRHRLVAALEKAASDMSLMDDPFPALFGIRMMECGPCGCPPPPGQPEPFCCPICLGYLQDEYHQGRNSLKALRQFLSDIERLEGPKSVVFFHENGVIEPSQLYPGIPPTADVADHLRMMEEVGAEATTAHAIVYPVAAGSTGGAGDLAVNFGANLAEFTGGRYNRNVAGIAEILTAAGRGPACLYRIGILPPNEEGGRLYQARVEVRGRTLAARYRVQHLDERDRWLRQAVAVLKHPEEATELPLSAAILPIPSEEGRWDLAIQVAVDPSTITATRATKGVQENWEVGAILTRDEDKQDWQMLALSRMSGGEEGHPVPVLHERLLRNVKPGDWKLAAFVRDRIEGSFGGARASLTLPKSGRDALLGPLPLRTERMRVVSDLPAFRDEEQAPAATTGRVSRGTLPAPVSPLGPGEGLEMRTWVCPATPGPPAGRLLRYIARDGKPEFRLEDLTPRPAGRCFVLEDRIETEALPPGPHRFLVRWERAGAPSLDAEAPFEVGGPAILPATAAPESP